MQEMIVNNLTDRDKIIRTLAGVKSHCQFKQWSGICDNEHTSKCQFCPTGKRFEHCYEQLPDFDKLCVDNLADEMMAEHLKYTSIPNGQVDDSFVSVRPPKSLASELVKATGAITMLVSVLYWFVKGLLAIR